MKIMTFGMALAAAVALVACGGGGGGGGGGGSGSAQVSSVNATNSGYTATATLRLNQQAYFQVIGSNLPSTLELTVADCASMSTVSTSATEAHFQCMPGGTAGNKAVTVKNQTGGTTLYSNTVAVAPAVTPPSGDTPLPVPTYGFNLGNTFEATWGAYSVPTRAVFTNAAKAGFNAVRIPCAWDFNSDPTTHIIKPAYMAQVKQAVDDALAEGLYVVINDHWDGGWLENHIGATVDPALDAKMKTYWTQIATAFANYDNHLLFAGANEPNIASPVEMATLKAYYQTFINAVRATGGNNTNRWLVLQSVSTPSWLSTLPTDSTPGRLMVEYHNYTPSLFTITHTDQNYGNAIYFWGAAYHYAGNPSRNSPAWEEGTIDAGYQELKAQYVDKGIPVMIGEFGAFVAGNDSNGAPILSGNDALYNRASVLYWNKYAVDSAQAHGLSPFYWSTPDSLYKYATGAVQDAETVKVLTGGAAPAPLTGAPSAVTGLSATASTGQVSLSWNAVNGATSYQVYRAAESGSEQGTPVVSGITGTSYTDTGLNPGTTYYYQVVAVNGSGPSGYTREANATTPGTNPDPAQFNFETDTQYWAAGGAPMAGVSLSSAQHFGGQQSLAVNFNGTAAGNSMLTLSDVVLPAGATVTFHVWIPAGHQITSIEPIAQDYNWAWTQSWYGSFTADAWNTLTLKVPLTYQDSNNVTQTTVTPLKKLNLKFTTGAAWTGTVYVDSISWSAP
jgi:hypothetical protein